MHFYEKLETTLDNVVTKNILLLGDFNAKHQEWCSRDVTTHHGNALKDLMDSYGLTQLCTEPTHLDHEGNPTVFWIWFSLMTRTPSILQWTFSHLSIHQTIYLLLTLSTAVLPKIIFLNTTRTHLKIYIYNGIFHKNITIIWPMHSFLKIGNMSLSLL